MRLILAAVSLAVLASTPLAAKPAPRAAAAIDPALAAAVADKRRDGDRARDEYRHPGETMAFFRIAPGMKVGEYAPGGEWISRLLGLYLGDRGRLVGLFFNPSHPNFNDKTREGIRAGVAKYPADVAAFTGLPADRFAAMTLESIPDAEKGTFDRIVIMRMVHNLMRWNIADSEIRAMRDLLKPDGLVGIEQHRARPDAPFSYTDGSKGYLREADVIKLMEINGFDFVARSNINANPRDTANWPDGVWTLPPTYALKDQDRARYQAVGESDRMTLLFRKRP